MGVHFGSRGFGNRTATGFMRIAWGGTFDAGAGRPGPFGPGAKSSGPGGAMESPPLLLPAAAPRGQDYLEAMAIAGEYAYAGREAVVDRVRRVLGADITDSVHNHHNFAWKEQHDGESVIVVRKGATPAFPGQRGF